MLLSGDAGLGKTRLASELGGRAAKLGFTVLWGGCSGADLEVPYLPFLEAIGNHLSTLADLTPMREGLGHAASELARVFPQIGIAPPGTSTDDPSHAKLRFFEAVVSLMRWLAAARPLLLVVEDVHWADGSTHELADYLSRRLGALPILLLATCRPEEIDRHHRMQPTLNAWRRARLRSEITLAPFAPRQVEEMVCSILDQGSIRPELRDDLYRGCDGNPFVLEELLKEALDRGHLVRAADGLNWRHMADHHVPATVTHAIVSRVDRLDRNEARTLRAAAVLGRTFAEADVSELTGLDLNTVQSSLEACVGHQLLQDDPLNVGHFRFRHSITREAVYSSIVAPRRREHHLRAADVLEAKAAPTGERARHLLLGGEVARAVPLLVQAADEAMCRYAAAEAAALCHQALPHMEDLEGRGLVSCKLGEAVLSQGDATGAEEWLTRSAQILGDVRNAAGLARARTLLGQSFWDQGRGSEAEREYDAARALLEPLGPSEELAWVYVRLAQKRGWQWDSEAAVTWASRAATVADACRSSALHAMARTYLGLGYCQQGQVDSGLQTIDDAAREAQSQGLHGVALSAVHAGIHVRVNALRTPEVPEQLNRLRMSKAFARVDELWALTSEGWCHFASGQLHQVDSCIAAARPIAEELRQFLADRDLNVLDAWVHLEKDDVGAARAVLPPLSGIDNGNAVDGSLWASIAVSLAEDDVRGAVELAQRSVRVQGASPWLSEIALDALAQGGQVIEARDLLSASNLFRGPAPEPYLLRATARMSLAVGELAAAVRDLQRAATYFVQAGEVLEDLRTRVLLVPALGDSGRADEAAACLTSVLQTARRQELFLIHRRALEAGRALGLPVSDVSPAAAPLAARDDDLDAIREARTSSVRRGDMRPESRMVPTSGAPNDGYGHSLDPPGRGGSRQGRLWVLVASAPESEASLADGPHRAAAAIIDEVQRWAIHTVRRHRGALETVAGDIIVATFEDGDDHDPRSVDALQAGMALMEKARLVGFPVRTGLAVGPMEGSHLAQASNRRLASEATNLARRLLVHADADELVLSDEAFRRVQGWVDDHRVSVTSRRLCAEGIDGLVAAYVVRASSAGRPASLGLALTAPTTQRPTHVLSNDGEYWTIEYGTAIIRVKDTKGLRDLATLVANPGRQIAAVDLATSSTLPRPVAQSDRTTLSEMGTERDIGPALDGEATRQYRQRLVDLDEDISAAELANDPERASLARREREFLLGELKVAIGLGGRHRRLLDPAERARKAVTWRIRDTIVRIEAADKSVGRHFRESVRTGAFCVYDPREAANWLVSPRGRHRPRE